MYVHVKVQAGAGKEKFTAVSKTHFNVSVKEKAEHNEANHRVVEIIAAHLRIPRECVRIVNGHHSPSKLLSISETSSK